MKKYKIKYQKGDDILIVEREEKTVTQLRYWFYMENPNCDIISIEEVTDDEAESQQS